MSGIRDMAGHHIRRLNQISTAVFLDRMERESFDITPVQYAALATIEMQPGIDQATLAGAIAHDRATIGGVIDRLERKGLVLRRTNAKDRRAKALGLSAEGKRMLEDLRPIVLALQADILTGLDESEREQFLTLLKKLTDRGNNLSRSPLSTLPADKRARSTDSPQTGRAADARGHPGKCR